MHPTKRVIVASETMRPNMDFALILKAIVMGIVEGLTEFLPISSTGHLIIVGQLLHFDAAIGSKALAELFEVVIQIGAILAVIVYFARDLIGQIQRALQGDRAARLLLLNVLIAFIPAAAIGFLFRKQLSALFNPISVAIAMIVGGIIILVVENLVQQRSNRQTTQNLEAVTSRQALGIGIAQIAALWSGMSRSASTLVGGLLIGLDRPTALRFSFYLSIPTLLAAGLFDLVRGRDLLTGAIVPALVVGLVVSFIVALAVIKFFLGYVARRNLVPFAWYRIIAGIVVLAYFLVVPK